MISRKVCGRLFYSTENCQSLISKTIVVTVLAAALALAPLKVFTQTGSSNFRITDAYILVEKSDDGSTDPAIFGSVVLRLLKNGGEVRRWTLFSRSEAAGARVTAPQGQKVKLGEINTSFDIPDSEVNSYQVALDSNLTDYDASSSNDLLGSTTVTSNLSDFAGGAELSTSLTGEGTVKVAVKIAKKNAPNANARRFDEYTWLTSHNAFVNYSDARWAAPNQSFGIIGQLDRGVRGLMLDTYSFSGSNPVTCGASFGSDCYKAGIYLCHGGCSGFPGSTYALPRQNLKDVMDNIGDWLAANTQETDIVTLFFEDYTNAGELATVIRNSKAAKYIFNPNGAWRVSDKGFPTVSYMAERNQRLLLFTSESKNQDTSLGLNYDRSFNVENYWSIGAGGAKYECTSRWDNDPALNKKETNFKRLFVMNHFRDVPSTPTAAFDNSLANLNERLVKCKMAAGTFPNYLALDFVELGSGKNLVDTINRAWENARVNQAATIPNFSGNWRGYFPDGTKSAYVWAISQAGSSLTITDVGGTSTTKFSGRVEGGKIIDSNNKTGTLFDGNTKISWSDGVVWIRQ